MGSDDRIKRVSEGARRPDFVGAGSWCAWRVKLPAIGQRERPDHDATVGMWLLFCPGAHLAWSYWWLTLIHLRPIDGVPPAKITTSGAGWELMCCAQSPDDAPNPDDAASLRMLHPLDWIVQFGDVPDDTRAREVAELVVKSIMRGDCSPDQDFRSFWKRIIPGTAKCVATGKHSAS